MEIYEFLKNILETEYRNIVQVNNDENNLKQKKKSQKNKKKNYSVRLVFI